MKVKGNHNDHSNTTLKKCIVNNERQPLLKQSRCVFHFSAFHSSCHPFHDVKRLDVQCRVDKTNFQFSLPIFKSPTSILLQDSLYCFFIERPGGSEGQQRKSEVISSDDILAIVEIGLAQITLHHFQLNKKNVLSNLK